MALVYDDAYGAYRHADWHPLQPRRVKLTVELIRETGLAAQAELLQPRQAGEAELNLVHSPDYVELVKKLGHGEELTRQDLFRATAAGFASQDNPVFPDMHEASALIAGGSLVAAEAVHSGRAAHAFNPAGGLHHAMREMASGFCVYNDVAIAAAWLRQQGHRVAVVDVDVHHGDGTQAAFYSDPEVLTTSLHQLSLGFFPGTGYPEEIGAGAAAGTSINLPCPPATWDEPWLRGFDEVVPALLREFKPSILVTQCGCDTHLLDPLANLRCSTRLFPHVGRRFHDLTHELCDGRWVALGGGGYAVEEVVPRAWTLLFAEMTEHPELAAHLNDEHGFPPAPEIQELVWPEVEQALRALDAALEVSRDRRA